MKELHIEALNLLGQISCLKTIISVTEVKMNGLPEYLDPVKREVGIGISRNTMELAVLQTKYKEIINQLYETNEGLVSGTDTAS